VAPIAERSKLKPQEYLEWPSSLHFMDLIDIVAQLESRRRVISMGTLISMETLD
jgi:hypothetical protein